MAEITSITPLASVRVTDRLRDGDDGPVCASHSRGSRRPSRGDAERKKHSMSSTEVSTEVRTERAGTSLLITIDRPKARNAVNAAVAAGVSTSSIWP